MKASDPVGVGCSLGRSAFNGAIELFVAKTIIMASTRRTS
jgi:hypothetical protein